MNSSEGCRFFVLALLVFWSHSGHATCDVASVASLREGLEAAKKSNCQRSDLLKVDSLIKALQRTTNCDPSTIMRLKRSLQNAKVATTLNESGEPCRTHVDSALERLANLTTNEGP